MIAALFHDKPLRRRLVAGSIAALACGAAMVRHGARSEASNAEQATPDTKLVKTVTVAPTNNADTRVAIGEIRPRRESDLGFRVRDLLLQRSPLFTAAALRLVGLLAAFAGSFHLAV